MKKKNIIIGIVVLLVISGTFLLFSDNKRIDGYSKDIELSSEDTINVLENINKIIDNGPVTSSNPLDYIKASQAIYNELLKYPKETFKYAIKDLIDTDANEGLKSYIEAKLCSEINDSFQYNFASATDFLEHYKEYLTKSYTDFNEYDKYAKKLLKWLKRPFC